MNKPPLPITALSVLAGLFAASLAQAQALELRVEPARVVVGAPVRITVQAPGAQDACGLRVEFGDGPPATLVVDRTARTLQRRWGEPGRYTVRAEGERVRSGVETALACSQPPLPVVVEVLPAPGRSDAEAPPARVDDARERAARQAQEERERAARREADERAREARRPAPQTAPALPPATTTTTPTTTPAAEGDPAETWRRQRERERDLREREERLIREHERREAQAAASAAPPAPTPPMASPRAPAPPARPTGRDRTLESF